MAAPAKPDDLKRISGVGRVIEKKLNESGVTTYAQIAKWTKADATKIGDALNFRGRVERDNWISQAKILAEGGETEFSKRVDKGDVASSKS